MSRSPYLCRRCRHVLGTVKGDELRLAPAFVACVCIVLAGIEAVLAHQYRSFTGGFLYGLLVAAVVWILVESAANREK